MRATSLTGCLLGVLLGGCATAPEPEVPNAQAAAPEPAQAQAKPTLTPPAGLPPLLDRELFFGDPEISGAQLSPDGKYLSFLKPLDGTRNIWVKKLEEPFDKARPITDDTKRPITSYFWSRDSKFVLYAQDQAGDENYNVFAVDPAAANAEGRKVPAARNLTDAKGARAQITRRAPSPIPTCSTWG